MTITILKLPMMMMVIMMKIVVIMIVMMVMTLFLLLKIMMMMSKHTIGNTNALSHERTHAHTHARTHAPAHATKHVFLSFPQVSSPGTRCYPCRRCLPSRARRRVPSWRGRLLPTVPLPGRPTPHPSALRSPTRTWRRKLKAKRSTWMAPTTTMTTIM